MRFRVRRSRTSEVDAFKKHLDNKCRGVTADGCKSWMETDEWTWMYMTFGDGSKLPADMVAAMLVKDDGSPELIILAFWSKNPTAAKLMVAELKRDLTKRKFDNQFANTARLVDSLRAVSPEFFSNMKFNKNSAVFGSNFPPHIVERYVSSDVKGRQFGTKFPVLSTEVKKKLGWGEVVDKTKWENMCTQKNADGVVVGGVVWGEWSREAMKKAQYIYVVWGPEDATKTMGIVGLMLVQDCMAKDDDGAMCLPDELYINALCGAQSRGSGSSLVGALESDIKAGAFVQGDRMPRRIRLYSVKSAQRWWNSRGFSECEDACVTSCTPLRKTHKLSADARETYISMFRDNNEAISTDEIEAQLRAIEEVDGFRMTKCVLKSTLSLAIANMAQCIKAVSESAAQIRTTLNLLHIQ